MNRVDVLDHGYCEPVEFWGSDERVIRQYAVVIASQLAQKFPRTLALFAEGCAA